MSEAATTARVNRDWEERDFVEMMQLNVLKITEFLNRFDTSTRYRLAKLDEKLAVVKNLVALRYPYDALGMMTATLVFEINRTTTRFLRKREGSVLQNLKVLSNWVL